jgi:hypothetical protein
MPPLSEYPPSIIVFGTGPHNVYDDWLKHPHPDCYLEEAACRSCVAKEVIIQVSPQAIIFVGGQRWISKQGVITEALYMRNLVIGAGEAPSSCGVYLAEDGVETTEQVRQSITTLEHHHLLPGRVHVVSSWHQLMYVKILFEAWADTKIIAHPAAEVAQTLDLFLEKAINGVGGFLYMCLLILMQRHKRWLDGGPYLSHVIKKRKDSNISLQEYAYLDAK